MRWREARLTHLGLGALLAWLLLTLIYKFGVAVVSSVGLPFDLEHLEGDLLVHICGIQQGLSPYPDWLSTRVGWLYGPLYYFAAAAFTDCASGYLYVGARLVSLASYVCSTWFVIAFVDRWTGVRRLTLAYPLFVLFTLAQFHALGDWYYLVRVDTLAVLLGAVGWWATIGAEGRPLALLGAGFATALAVSTKHSLLAQLPFQCALLALRGRRPWRLVASDALTLAAPTVFVSLGIFLGAGGPLWHHLFEIPALHGGQPEIARKFWPEDILGTAGPQFAVTLVYLAILARTGRRRLALGLGAALIPAVVNGYLSRRHSGGFVNVVIPAVFLINAIAATAVVDLYQRWGQSSTAKRRLAALAVLALMVAGGAKRSGIRQFRNDPDTAAYAARMVELARHFDVIFSDTPESNLLASKIDWRLPTHEAIDDSIRGPDAERLAREGRYPAAAINYVSEQIRARKPEILVLNGFDFEKMDQPARWFFYVDPRLICAGYRWFGEIAYDSTKTMMSPTGGFMRPRYVFVRRNLETDALARVRESLPSKSDVPAGASSSCL